MYNKDKKWFKEGIKYFKKDDFDKGIEAFKHSLEIDPKNSDCWYILGSCYSEKKEYDKAINALNKCLEIKFDIELYEKLKHIEKSFTLEERGILLLILMKRYAQAIEKLKKCKRIAKEAYYDNFLKSIDNLFKKIDSLEKIKKEEERKERRREEYRKKEEQRKKEVEIKAKEQEKKDKELEEIKENLDAFQKGINNLDLIKNIQSMTNINTDFWPYQNKRSKIMNELQALYQKYKDNEVIKDKIIDFVVQYYSQYLEFDPYSVDSPYFPTYFKSMMTIDFSYLNEWKDNYARDSDKIKRLHKSLGEIDYDSQLDQILRKKSEEVKELIFDVPVQNLYNFLLDFSNVIIDPNMSKIEGPNENEYTLKCSFGPLHFKFIVKEQNRKIVYEYDFLQSNYGERGKAHLDFIEISPGSVKLKIKNEIQELSKTRRETMMDQTFFGDYIKSYIDLNLGKLVAKQVQTIISEKSFDDLTMKHYKMIEEKIKDMDEDISKLEQKFYEIKAPLTLDTFDCPKCGANLNIISKNEEIIICKYCKTPFLINWQKD